MQITTKTMFLSALMLTAITQPANAMFEKYKTAVAFVGGVTLGAGLVYWYVSLDDKKKSTIIPQKTEEPKKTELTEKVTLEKPGTPALDLIISGFPFETLNLGRAFCSVENFNILKNSESCVFTAASPGELELYSFDQKNKITLYKKNSDKNDLFYLKDLPRNLDLALRTVVAIVHNKNDPNKIEFQV